jgi:hypothetical protein
MHKLVKLSLVVFNLPSSILFFLYSVLLVMKGIIDGTFLMIDIERIKDIVQNEVEYCYVIRLYFDAWFWVSIIFLLTI